MKEVPLINSKKVAIVDDEFYELVSKYKWRLIRSGYPARSYWDKTKKQPRVTYIHREIMKTPKGMHTDHIDGNKLDNRKENLRICTASENKMNSKKQVNNKSGIIGVYWNKGAKMWQAQVVKNKKNHFIGFFKDKFEAGRARDKAVKEMHGEFAKLNDVRL